MQDLPEELVARARAGDPHALEDVLRAVKDDVYGLAVRMLGLPEDAKDATQEILLKVARNLSTFRGESSLRTWVWAIAARHLGACQKSAFEEQFRAFEVIEVMLQDGERRDVPDCSTPEEQLQAEEVKIGCTGAMLIALDRDDRIAFTLAEVFLLTSEEAAQVLGISPAAFRKRLQRARDRLGAFMQRACGLVDAKNSCRCERRIDTNVKLGLLNVDALLFAVHPAHMPSRRAGAERVREASEIIARIGEIYRNHPDYVASEGILDAIRQLIAHDTYSLFADTAPRTPSPQSTTRSVPISED